MISFGAFGSELENILMEKAAAGPVNPGTTSLFQDIAGRFLKKGPKDIASSRSRAAAMGALEQQKAQDALGAYAKKHGRNFGKTAGVGKLVGKIKAKPMSAIENIKMNKLVKSNPSGSTFTHSQMNRAGLGHKFVGPQNYPTGGQFPAHTPKRYAWNAAQGKNILVGQ